MRMPRVRPSTCSTSATTHSASSRYLRSPNSTCSDMRSTTPKASVHKYLTPFGQMPSERIQASLSTTYRGFPHAVTDGLRVRRDRYPEDLPPCRSLTV